MISAAGNGLAARLLAAPRVYEPQHRSEESWPLAVHFAAGQAPLPLALPASVPLRRSGWRIRRQVRSESHDDTKLLATLVDAPFYARSLLHTRLAGASALTVHESLDLDRFRSRWVQWMLPFRMPRRARNQRVGTLPSSSS